MCDVHREFGKINVHLFHIVACNFVGKIWGFFSVWRESGNPVMVFTGPEKSLGMTWNFFWLWNSRTSPDCQCLGSLYKYQKFVNFHPDVSVRTLWTFVIYILYMRLHTHYISITSYGTSEMVADKILSHHFGFHIDLPCSSWLASEWLMTAVEHLQWCYCYAVHCLAAKCHTFCWFRFLNLWCKNKSLI